MMQSTPARLGYQMPAEWEPQEAVWLTWPHNDLTWPGKLLEQVQLTYLQIIHSLHAGEKVKLLVKDADECSNVRARLIAAGTDVSRVVFFEVAAVDSWIRDYGPTFVMNRASRQLAIVKWIFNAWGQKYEDLLEDDRVVEQLNQRLQLRMFEPGIVLEGGSIDVNGSGVVLTTEQCLLNQNRNPHLRRAEVEESLKQYLNVSTVLWLREGIVGDDTDGHIDDIARFVSNDTVVCAVEDDSSDPNYAVLRENYDRLVGFGLKVVALPMPGEVSDGEARLPASYANFYIGNSAVVVPTFGHPNDSRALEIIQKCFPSRRVTGIDTTAMVHGLGTIHCCSQQEPRV
jgi:agmatine deiminase